MATNNEFEETSTDTTDAEDTEAPEDTGAEDGGEQSASGEEIAEEAEYFYRGRPSTIGGISSRRSASGFTGRQFSGGGRIARNPFSPYGIGQMFGNVAGAFVAYEGLRAAMDLGGAFADAGRIESESSLNLRGFYNGETPSDFFTDPQTVFQSQQLASRQAQLRRIRGFEALPLVGGVVQFERPSRNGFGVANFHCGGCHLQQLGDELPDV